MDELLRLEERRIGNKLSDSLRKFKQRLRFLSYEGEALVKQAEKTISNDKEANQPAYMVFEELERISVLLAVGLESIRDTLRIFVLMLDIQEVKK